MKQEESDEIQRQPYPSRGEAKRGLQCNTMSGATEEYCARILTTARTLFSERGVDAVSMHQIAQAAGVGQGTLYRRYTHKGSLCEALLDEEIRQFQQELEAIAASRSDSALCSIEQILLHLMCFNESHAALLGAMADTATGEHRLDIYQNAFYCRLRQAISTLLERARNEGEIGNIDVDYTAYVLLAPLVIDLYLHQRQVLHVPTEQMASGLRQLLFEGLRSKV
jgi:AcrR family transcriptional regulator